MSIERTKSKQKVKEPKTKITWKEIKRQKVLLFWAAIMVVYGVVFYYLPLAGWTMAFQNYKPRLGIFHSQFVGWDKFRTLFSDMTLELDFSSASRRLYSSLPFLPEATSSVIELRKPSFVRCSSREDALRRFSSSRASLVFRERVNFI